MWKELYNSQYKDNEIEANRIIEMAGKLILEELSNMTFDNTQYILPNYDEKNIYDNIPKRLIKILKTVIRNKD